MGDGFYHLKPVPGGRFDRYLQQKRQKNQFKKMAVEIPKNPDQMVDMFVDQYGVDSVMDMDVIDIGDYVYDRGINHSLNMNVGRNIPWVEDGLKAVERRALYIMYKAGLYRGKFDKVAGITGDMIKHVHPHGDASAAETIYRLGRTRSTMIPYITPQGNFGNMEDMRPASPRYASASLSPYAMDCFFSEMGAKYPIFDVKDNYKYSDKEPVFLTSRYPNILMQWNLGIGKGAQAWLGAFNSKDIFKTALKMLDDPNAKIDIYPDTPIPVDIVNKKDLKGCFDKPKFKVAMRAQYEVVADKKKDDHGRVVDKYTLVFTSLPITVTGKTIKNEIIKIKDEDAKLKKGESKRLPEVMNIEISVSDKTPGGIRFIVEYEKGYDPHALAEKLFRGTSLAKTVGVNYTLITDNKPEFYSPRQVMIAWIGQRYDQKRRYYHQLVLKAAKDRSRLEAICTILEKGDNIDKAVKLIRAAKTNELAIQSLMKEFNFSEFQAACIIQVKLANLSKMNIEDTKKERDQALADYKHYRKLLSSESAIKEAIKAELEDGLKKYGRDRLAELKNLNDKSGSEYAPDQMKHIFYNSKYFWAVDDISKVAQLKDHLDKDVRYVSCMNQSTVVLFTSDGYNKILDGSAFVYTSDGIGFNQFGLNEVASVLVINDQFKEALILTQDGYGKRITIDDILKSNKARIMPLNTEDHVIAVLPYQDNSILAAQGEKTGKVYFIEAEAYSLFKRQATGFRALKLDEPIQSAGLFRKADYVMIGTEYGYVKVIPTQTIKLPVKRKAPSIDVNGRTMMSVIGLATSDTFGLISSAKIAKYQFAVGKMVSILSGKEERKFKISTSISDSTKLFKFGRNVYYQVINYPEKGTKKG